MQIAISKLFFYLLLTFRLVSLIMSTTKQKNRPHRTTVRARTKGENEMRNTALFKEFIDTYESKAFTDNYIFGIRYKGNIYMIKATSQILAYILKLDKASRGKGYSLRFKPNNTIRTMLLSMGAELICSAEMFDELVKASKYNKGEIFEMLVTEWYGQEWTKDSVPFTEDGDLTVDGTAYQIKYEQATFITEAQMMRLRG